MVRCQASCGAATWWFRNPVNPPVDMVWISIIYTVLYIKTVGMGFLPLWTWFIVRIPCFFERIPTFSDIRTFVSLWGGFFLCDNIRGYPKWEFTKRICHIFFDDLESSFPFLIGFLPGIALLMPLFLTQMQVLELGYLRSRWISWSCHFTRSKTYKPQWEARIFEVITSAKSAGHGNKESMKHHSQSTCNMQCEFLHEIVMPPVPYEA